MPSLADPRFFFSRLCLFLSRKVIEPGLEQAFIGARARHAITTCFSYYLSEDLIRTSLLCFSC